MDRTKSKKNNNYDDAANIIDKTMVYTSNMNKLRSMSLIVFIICAAMFADGIYMLSGRGSDIDVLVILMASVPMIISIAMLAVLFLINKTYQKRVVTISPKIFKYEENGRLIEMSWRELHVNTDISPEKRLLDKLTISDGSNTIRIERFFFKDYDQIFKSIKRIKQRAKDNTVIRLNSSENAAEDLRSLGIRM